MNEKELEELIDQVRGLIAGMPQPSQYNRTAAFFGVVVRAAGLEEDEALRAFLTFVRTEKNLPSARLDWAPDRGEWKNLAEDTGPMLN